MVPCCPVPKTPASDQAVEGSPFRFGALSLSLPLLDGCRGVVKAMLCARQIPLGPGGYENGRQWGPGAESRCRQLVAAAPGRVAAPGPSGPAGLERCPVAIHLTVFSLILFYKWSALNAWHLSNQYLWSYKGIYSIITGLVKWLVGEVGGKSGVCEWQ